MRRRAFYASKGRLGKPRENWRSAFDSCSKPINAYFCASKPMAHLETKEMEELCNLFIWMEGPEDNSG
jgi:hypothetical protein